MWPGSDISNWEAILMLILVNYQIGHIKYTDLAYGNTMTSTLYFHWVVDLDSVGNPNM